MMSSEIPGRAYRTCDAGHAVDEHWHIGNPVLAARWEHIPERYERLVRHVDWYSNRARGKRAKAQQPAKTLSAVEAPLSEFATHATAVWARLIRKVYEADPLECAKCKGLMCVIALTYHAVPDIA